MAAHESIEDVQRNATDREPMLGADDAWQDLVARADLLIKKDRAAEALTVAAAAMRHDDRFAFRCEGYGAAKATTGSHDSRGSTQDKA